MTLDVRIPNATVPAEVRQTFQQLVGLLIDWTDTSEDLVTTGTITGATITGANVTSGLDPGHTHTTLDEKVAIDSAATAGYIGGGSRDGVIRSHLGSATGGLYFSDQGDYVNITFDINNMRWIPTAADFWADVNYPHWSEFCFREFITGRLCKIRFEDLEEALRITHLTGAEDFLLADGSRDLTGNMAVDAGITIDGRDLSVDGTKLDGIESAADVTDAANVTAAGAAMSGGAFHDGFSDFVGNEHIDHTTITLTAGVGISGGGDISISRSFALDINGLTGEAAIVAADTFAFYDATAGASRKITLTELVAVLAGAADVKVGIDAGATAGYLGAAFNDGVLRTGTGISYADGGDFVTLTTNDGQIDHDSLSNYDANKHVDHTGVSISSGSGLSGGGDISTTRTLALDINSLGATAIAAGDFLPFWDITATATNKKITFANFEGTLNHDSLSNYDANKHVDHTGVTFTAGVGITGGGTLAANRTFDLDIPGLGAESAIVTADTIAFYDATAAAHKKVTFGELSTAIGASDEKVKIDAAAAAGYLGAANNDGVLRVSSPLTYTDGGDYVTLGTSAAELISSSTTLYIDTGGDDTTGDGSSGSPWLTLAKALSYLADKLIASEATVTIQHGDGTHAYTATDIITHVNGDRISITGENVYSRALSSVQSSSGSAGAWSIVLNVDSVASLAAGDYCLIPYNVAGGTRPFLLAGCWEITNVDAGNVRITITCTSEYASVPSGAVAATIQICKSILQYTGVGGIRTASGRHLGNINSLVLLGTGSGFGLDAQQLGTITGGASLGINGFHTGVISRDGSYVTTPDIHSSNNTVYNGRASYASAQFTRGAFTGSAGSGVNVIRASVSLSSCLITGNVKGLYADFGSMCRADSCKIHYNTGIGAWAHANSLIDTTSGAVSVNGTNLSPTPLNTVGNVESVIMG